MQIGSIWRSRPKIPNNFNVQMHETVRSGGPFLVFNATLLPVIKFDFILALPFQTVCRCLMQICTR